MVETKVLQKPIINVMHAMGMHGLIYRRRTCSHCMIYQCSMVYEVDSEASYHWKCNHCFKIFPVN